MADVSGLLRKYYQADDVRVAHEAECYVCARMITDCPEGDRLAETAAVAWDIFTDAAHQRELDRANVFETEGN